MIIRRALNHTKGREVVIEILDSLRGNDGHFYVAGRLGVI